MFISFGAINIKWILFLIFPLIIVLCDITKDQLKIEKNIFFQIFLKFLGRSLCFIFWPLLYKLLSWDSEIENEKNQINESIYKDGNIKEKQNTAFLEFIANDIKSNKTIINNKRKKNNHLLLLFSFLDFISSNIKFLVKNNKYWINQSAGLNIISSCTRLLFFVLFSKFLINNHKINRHQYFSGIVILIVAIIISILSFLYENQNNENFFIKLLLMILPHIFYCFKDACGAIYLIKSQGIIYKLIFINGIIGLILSGILQFILSLFNCNDIKDFLNKDEDKVCDGDKIKTIIVNFKSFGDFGSYISILLIIFYMAKYIFKWLLIFYFSLNHYAAIYTIPTLFKYIIKINESEFKVFYILGIVIITLMTLIYNEIIILKFCGLDKETKIEISKRASLDSACIQLNEIDSNDLDYHLGDIDGDNKDD